MSEKKKPTYNLATIQSVLRSTASLRMSGTARSNAVALGFSPQDVIDIIQALTPRDFYKSMTSNHNHREWQDVYRHMYSSKLTLYIKFVARGSGHFVLQLKEK